MLSKKQSIVVIKSTIASIIQTADPQFLEILTNNYFTSDTLTAQLTEIKNRINIVDRTLLDSDNFDYLWRYRIDFNAVLHRHTHELLQRRLTTSTPVHTFMKKFSKGVYEKLGLFVTIPNPQVLEDAFDFFWFLYTKDNAIKHMASNPSVQYYINPLYVDVISPPFLDTLEQL